MTTTTTGDMTDEDEPTPESTAAGLSPAERAVLDAEKAAKKARKAQQKADRLAAEAKRLAGADTEPGVEVAETAAPTRAPLITAAALLVACVAFLVVAVVVHVRGSDDSAQAATGVRDAALI